MDDDMNDSVVAEGIMLGDEECAERQPRQRLLKRPAPSAPSNARKHLNLSSIPPPGLSTRGTTASSIISAAMGNEGSDNVTYRIVQIASPSEEVPNLLRHQNIGQGATTTTQMITTNGQGEFVLNGNQQIVLNSSGRLAVGTSAVQEQSPTKLAYVASNPISLGSSPGNVRQAVQLQVDGNGSQYYIMLPSGTELASSPVAISTPNPRIITTPRLQRATFIPFSRLQTTHATLKNAQSLATASANVIKQLEFHSEEPAGVPDKEVKRRVSHNEVEKRRRDKINYWIGKLSCVVPNCANEYSAAKLPQSKGGVLAKTVAYIEELRETNDHLIDALRHYEAVSNTLKDENKQLRDLLQEAGLEPPLAITFDLPPVSDLLSVVNRSQSSSPPSTTASATSAAPVRLGELACTSGSVDALASLSTTDGTMVNLSDYVLVQTDKGLSLIRNTPTEQSNEHNDQHETEGTSDSNLQPE